MREWKKIPEILKSRRGFTLSETLITTLILLMVSSVVAAGVPAAANAYNKVLDAANAQVLLSTTVTELRRELSFALDVTDSTDESNKVEGSENSYYIDSYTNGENGYITKLDEKDGGIARTWENDFIKDTSAAGESGTPAAGEGSDSKKTTKSGFLSLISKSASTENLNVEYKGILYENGIFTVEDLKVVRKGTDTVLAGPVNLKIHASVMDH